jgi:hypothetical protein
VSASGEADGGGAGVVGDAVDHPQQRLVQRAEDDGTETVEPWFAGAGVARGDGLDGAVLAERKVRRLHRLEPAELTCLLEVGLLGQCPRRVQRPGVQPARDVRPVGAAARQARRRQREDVDVGSVQPASPQLDTGRSLLAQCPGDRHDVPGQPCRCDRHPCVEPHPRQAGGIRPHGNALRRIYPHFFAPSGKSRNDSGTPNRNVGPECLARIM